MSPQAILRARYSELAAELGVQLAVRRRDGRFYFMLQGHESAMQLFIAHSLPAARLTWSIWRKAHYFLPCEDVERVLAETPLDPKWLRWNDGTVVQIARGIRESCNFDGLPILADALEGCTASSLLIHCREGTPHHSTCWVVELVLGPKRAQPRFQVDNDPDEGPGWGAGIDWF